LTFQRRDSSIESQITIRDEHVTRSGDSTLLIGTAGWTLPRSTAPLFPGDGAHLARYGRVLKATEINSSFRRAHRRQTYARWAASVPDDFRFSVKLPKEITHVRRLVRVEALLNAFLCDVSGLNVRLGCLLVQLPPSLALIPDDADAFFSALRGHYQGDLAVEPRHVSWFAGDGEYLFQKHRLARVAADPARMVEAGIPGGWNGCVYWRLHGSPRTYYSAYSDADLSSIVAAVTTARRHARTTWCIFDNTALGAATGNALTLRSRVDAAHLLPAQF